MSAFVVGHKHINAIVTFANAVLGPNCNNYNDPQAMGQLLLDENVRSVNCRYGESNEGEPFVWKPMQRPIAPVQMLKALDCLEYQSCESSDFDSTPAAKLIQRLRSATIRVLPGYDEAAWEVR